MGLKMTHRKAVTSEAAKRYRTASKKQKSRILDEHVALTGRNRSYLSWLLRCWGTTVVERRDGELVKIVVGQRQKRRRSPRVYDEQVVAALKKVWYLFGCLCGKRLVAVLRTQLSVLEKFGELALDPDTRRKLQRISAATIDRLLRTEKRALRVRGRYQADHASDERDPDPHLHRVAGRTARRGRRRSGRPRRRHLPSPWCSPTPDPVDGGACRAQQGAEVGLPGAAADSLVAAVRPAH